MPASKQFSAPVGHAGLALDSRVADLRARLNLTPPERLAEHTGARYLEVGLNRGEFHFTFLNSAVVLTHPDFFAFSPDGKMFPSMTQALLVYYFLTSDGTAPTGKWISFAELPDGRVYATAFQGYTGDLLAKAIGNDELAFRRACEHQGGEPLALGDLSFRFQPLPRIAMAAVYHSGDEDFPPACRFLFDICTPHFLPTEGCAILGGMLARKLTHNIRESA